MANIIQSLLGGSMGGAMTDQVMATDLLMAAKSGVRNYALAITESATPEVRAVLRRHLQEQINAHEKIYQYMHDKGWYEAYNIPLQLNVDARTANTALNLSPNNDVENQSQQTQ